MFKTDSYIDWKKNFLYLLYILINVLEMLRYMIINVNMGQKNIIVIYIDV